MRGCFLGDCAWHGPIAWQALPVAPRRPSLFREGVVVGPLSVSDRALAGERPMPTWKDPYASGKARSPRTARPLSAPGRGGLGWTPGRDREPVAYPLLLSSLGKGGGAFPDKCLLLRQGHRRPARVVLADARPLVLPFAPPPCFPFFAPLLRCFSALPVAPLPPRAGAATRLSSCRRRPHHRRRLRQAARERRLPPPPTPPPFRSGSAHLWWAAPRALRVGCLSTQQM